MGPQVTPTGHGQSTVWLLVAGRDANGRYCVGELDWLSQLKYGKIIVNRLRSIVVVGDYEIGHFPGPRQIVQTMNT